MDEQPIKDGILRPDVGCESFEAGGVTYTRTDTLALGRGILLQRLQTEMEFSLQALDMQKKIMEAIADFDRMKLSDCAVKLKELADGTDVVGARRLRQVDICALFYNAPGEDAANDKYAKVVKPKVAAWRAAGMDTTFLRQQPGGCFSMCKITPSRC